MDLNDFKKTWKEVTSEAPKEKEIDVVKMKQMLHQRGTGILSRLDRNVKTGFWFLGLFILLTFVDQFMPYEFLFPAKWKDSMEVPVWINILEWSVNLILIFTFLIFVVRYKKLQVHTLANQDLKSAIEKVLSLLDTFKKEFYFALLILLSAIGVGFLSGVLKGFETVASEQKPTSLAIAFIVFLLLIILILITGSIFFIFHKGFNILFGKYREQLNASLHELQEKEE